MRRYRIAHIIVNTPGGDWDYRSFDPQYNLREVTKSLREAYPEWTSMVITITKEGDNEL